MIINVGEKEKAKSVSYDNTNSKLNSNNVQGALDEVYNLACMSDNNLISAPVKKDLLLVSLTDPNSDHNMVHKIHTADATTLTSSPITSGYFIGKWECIFFSKADTGNINGRVMVKITELYPRQGRVWYNHYNSLSKWTGWFTDWNMVVEKYYGDMTSTPLKTNLLDVDLKNPLSSKNKAHKIGVNDASTLSNSPITTGAFFGEWEYTLHTISGDKSRAMVKVTEYFPVNGRVWYNHYNWTKWTGWRNDYDRITDNVNTLNTTIGGKAPTNHASAETTYGVGNSSNYGHVKLSDTYNSKVNNGASANGLGASQNALYNAYNVLNTQHTNLKAQLIPNTMKIEAGTVTTSGTTRTITLNGSYTKMLYFNIGNNGNPSFPVFLPVGVTFTAPNKVTFSLKVYGNNGVDDSTTGYETGYIFVGQ